MVPWHHLSNFKGVIEEVESINEVDRLKAIARKLVEENQKLSHRTNTALKSLENQNILINYLQETLITMMTQNALKTKKFWTIVGCETLRTLDNMLRYQLLLCNMIKLNCFQESEKTLLSEFYAAACTVPSSYIRTARSKVASFLTKLKSEVLAEADEEGNFETEVLREMINDIDYQNDRINSLARKRKKHYRFMAKRNECRTSRKHSLNKPESSKSESSGKKNSRYAKLANSGETSQSDTEDIQPKNFPKRRRIKRKVEAMNDKSGSKSDTESSVSVNITPLKQTASTKKMKSDFNSSISNSSNESIKLKSLVIKLNDFMTDPSADNDQYVAQYKQANCDKINEEEFHIVDDMDDDVDDDQEAESNHNSDNNEEDVDNQEDRISPKSHEFEEDKLEQDSTVFKSTVSQEESLEPPSNPTPNGKKGPCTPPLSPAPVEYISKRGPRTPSLSPPATRRGPRTPPGLAPTSDSEATDDEGDSSDSSAMSATY